MPDSSLYTCAIIYLFLLVYKRAALQPLIPVRTRPSSTRWIVSVDWDSCSAQTWRQHLEIPSLLDPFLLREPLLESPDFAAQSSNPIMKCWCLLALVGKPSTSIVSDAIIAKSLKENFSFVASRNKRYFLHPRLLVSWQSGHIAVGCSHMFKTSWGLPYMDQPRWW
jgi:hypothetical protein